MNKHYSPNIDFHESMDPPFDCRSRKSSWTIATFNLLSTMVGGGTLSIPYVFYKCGWFIGTLLMLFSMIVNNNSLKILCLLNRTYGCNSYSEIMEKAFGSKGKKASSALVFGILTLVIIAFLVLLRDIAASIVEYFSPTDFILTVNQKNLLVTILVGTCYPVMVADQLYSLRFISYMGTICVIFLLFILFYKAIIYNFFTLHSNTSNTSDRVRLGPNDWNDLLTAIPITLISYFCHCSVITVYSELQRPTDERMNRIIDYLLYISSTIYIAFGLCGYFFAYDNTDDNILDNFSSHDISLVIARFGLLLTLLCQLPMIVVPCRKTFYPLFYSELNTITRKRTSSGNSLCSSNSNNSLNQVNYHSISTLIPSQHRNNSSYNQINNNIFTSLQQNNILSFDTINNNNNTPKSDTTDIEMTDIITPIETHNEFSIDELNISNTSNNNVEEVLFVDEGFEVSVTNSTSRYIITFLIIIFTLMISENVPGVSTIWTIAGSSLCILVAFFLPYLAYIYLYTDELGSKYDLYIAYMYVIGSAALIILCTHQAIDKAINNKT
jgi:sodium-coupled neutral amino acid transporter 6